LPNTPPGISAAKTRAVRIAAVRAGGIAGKAESPVAFLGLSGRACFRRAADALGCAARPAMGVLCRCHSHSLLARHNGQACP
jgi:hypothetical protein